MSKTDYAIKTSKALKRLIVSFSKYVQLLVYFLYLALNRISRVSLKALFDLSRSSWRLIVLLFQLEKEFFTKCHIWALKGAKLSASCGRLLFVSAWHLTGILLLLEWHLLRKTAWLIKTVAVAAWNLLLITNKLNILLDQMVASLFLWAFLLFYRFVDSVSIAATASMLWTVRLMKRWKSEKFTFVMVPHEGGQMRKMQLNKLVVYSGAFTLSFTALFLFISSMVLFNINENLTNEIFASREKAANLMAINQSYEEEVDKLTENAIVVSKKLNELSDLEYKIRDMVGLNISSSAASYDDLSKPLSRSADRTVILSADSGIYVPEDGNEILALIENERESIDKFSKDLEIRLDFLDSRPDRMPTIGRLTSAFGFRIHPITGKRDYHKGIDLANKQGTKIVAAGSGIVTYVGYNGGYGRMVIISHGYGYKTIYAHLKSASVRLGDEVKKGQAIASMGNTGVSTAPHLHFEIHYNGKQINPLNILD